MNQPKKNKVLVIGWDAADWKVIAPLMDAGKMPHLEGMVREGVMGNLSTLTPVLSPMLWTSIATGKRPFKHGIHGFSEPDPDTGTIRPVTTMSRTTKAIWNILNQHGLRSNVVGWWPSHPAEPINGVMVSNHYHRVTGAPDNPNPMMPGTVYPERLIQPLEEMRIHPGELGGEELLPFVPKAAEIDQEKDPRLASAAKILAECASVHAAATAIIQLEDWDFMGVYYDAIDHFGHGFMKYHPPKLPWISDEDFELYKDVVEGGYIFHDLMLGTLLKLAGEDTTVILVSDHGFHPDHLRPGSLPNEPAGPAAEHREFGIVAMKGPGIKKDELIFGASLLDVTPTILSIYGLPIGEDMDGKPLLSAFETPPAIETIASWDEIDEGDAGMLPPEAQLDPVEAQEAVRQLIELGYIDEPDENQEKAVDDTLKELRYNLARSYQGAGYYREAAEIYEELIEKFPEESRFSVKLLDSLLGDGRAKEARAALERLIANKETYGAEAREELAALSKEHDGDEPEGIPENVRFKMRKLSRQASTNRLSLSFLEANVLTAERKYEEALALYDEIAQAAPDYLAASVHLKRGDVLIDLKRWKQAEAAFESALDADPVNRQAQVGLARAFLGRQQNRKARDAAMAALGLIQHDPSTHVLLGTALHRMGYIPEAVRALETAIAQNPVNPAAHKRLAHIFAVRLNDREKAEEHKRFAAESAKRIADHRDGKERPSRIQTVRDFAPDTPRAEVPSAISTPLKDSLVVVSGLPRSGTSMMMQMLDAGGIEVLTDGVREADASNPRGYYEFEGAKSVGRDNRWLADAKGKSVKIVAQLLPRMAQEHVYRVILMERDLDAVVTSQARMLERMGRKGGAIEEGRLKVTFARQLDRVHRILYTSPNVAILRLSYDAALADPAAAAAKVNAFLDGTLDEAAMTGAVAPELRNHEAPPATAAE